MLVEFHEGGDDFLDHDRIHFSHFAYNLPAVIRENQRRLFLVLASLPIAAFRVTKRANIPVERTRSVDRSFVRWFVRVSLLPVLSLYRRFRTVRSFPPSPPSLCPVTVNFLRLGFESVTKHGPERDKQLCRKRESVRETHERDERSVVCVRKHVATRVRRSKAHTRETQFKPKERERAAATLRRFSDSRTTHWVARVSVRRS